MGATELRDWRDMAGSHAWSSLLLGNGFSINIWSSFAYESLFASARLKPQERRVFERLGTTDFERVLEMLSVATDLVDSLGGDAPLLRQERGIIRRRLFSTIRRLHPKATDIGKPVHARIAAALSGFRSVYTLNYDLVPYWSAMTWRRRIQLNDRFSGPGGTFRHDDVRDDHIRWHYLHGALHLWRDVRTGAEGKLVAEPGQDLLAQLGTLLGRRAHREPLFVSEGSAAQKRNAIARSPYLRDCLDRLRADQSPTVVFGAALGPSDLHVATALSDGEARPIAVSVYPGRPAPELAMHCERLRSILRGHDVAFFDSTTHPLGAPELRCG